MKLPLQIQFRDLVPLPSLEGEIRDRAAKLEQFVPELMSCHVVVEAEGNRHHQGHRYVVRVEARVPGDTFVTGDHQGNTDIALAMHGAFDAMGRKLEDWVRIRRGQVKHHEPRPQRGAAAEGGEPD